MDTKHKTHLLSCALDYLSKYNQLQPFSPLMQLWGFCKSSWHTLWGMKVESHQQKIIKKSYQTFQRECFKIAFELNRETAETSAVGLCQFAKCIKITHFSLSALLSLCWLCLKPGSDSVSQTKTEKGNEEQAIIACACPFRALQYKWLQ